MRECTFVCSQTDHTKRGHFLVILEKNRLSEIANGFRSSYHEILSISSQDFTRLLLGLSCSEGSFLFSAFHAADTNSPSSRPTARGETALIHCALKQHFNGGKGLIYRCIPDHEGIMCAQAIDANQALWYGLVCHCR